MKISDIAKKYNLNEKEFKKFLYYNHFPVKMKLSGDCIEGDIEGYVNLFNKHNNEEKCKEEENINRKREKSKMLISSGFNFEGYKIVKYSGYISGDDSFSIDRGYEGFFNSATNVGEEITKALVKIRRNALNELKDAAYDLGCNAVIGVDFDYFTLEPETVNISGGTTYLPYVICVTANGNAVIIEKEDQ